MTNKRSNYTAVGAVVLCKGSLNTPIAVLLSLVGPEFGWTVAGLATAGWAGGMYVLSRKIFSYISRKKRIDLQQLSDRIAEIAAESTRDRLDGEQATRALPG